MNRPVVAYILPPVILTIFAAILLLSVQHANSAGETVQGVFLPLVISMQPSPTPVPAPLINGNFELGRGVGWSEYSANDYHLVVNAGEWNLPTRSGVWAAWMGGAENEISILSQAITVPPHAPRLYFWYWITSQDLCHPDYDIAGVLINDQAVDAFLLCAAANTNGWVLREVDLAAYAGQAVGLHLVAATDSTLNSNLFIDDVALGTPLQPVIGGAPFALEVDHLMKTPAVGPSRAALPPAVNARQLLQERLLEKFPMSGAGLDK
jgi:hypothetical protein